MTPHDPAAGGGVMGDANKELFAFGRIAFRVEGALWCAYYAQPDTMDGAIFLASIKMSFVQNQENKNKFMQLIQDGITETIKEEGHKIERWNYKVAPEHERGGNA